MVWLQKRCTRWLCFLLLLEMVLGSHHKEYDKDEGFFTGKLHLGRHVCTNYKNVSHPVKTKQPYCKPIYKQYRVKCFGQQLCSGVRVFYERHYKDVLTTRTINEVHHSCCPGWAQVTNKSHGCNKPVCLKPCLNGGKCVKPDLCSCPAGFSGVQCEIGCNCANNSTCLPSGICECSQGFQGPTCSQDIDECVELKPCDHKCFNTYGSYRCQCKEDFILQEDGQTCRKESDFETTALEAKDMEQELQKRIFNLEASLLVLNESRKSDVSKSDILSIYRDLDFITKDTSTLKSRLMDVEKYKTDLHVFKNKLGLMEDKVRQLDDLLKKFGQLKKCAHYDKTCMKLLYELEK